jgi:hypothetical protein
MPVNGIIRPALLLTVLLACSVSSCLAQSDDQSRTGDDAAVVAGESATLDPIASPERDIAALRRDARYRGPPSEDACAA